MASLLLLLPGSGEARPGYPSSVPNGSTHSCATCHLSPSGGGTLNDFGDDYSGNGGDWLAIHDLDSDGDGQSNGQELGDPCGEWEAGATPGRTSEVGNPGDAESTSTTPEIPACGGSDGGSVVADAAPFPQDAGPQTDVSPLPPLLDAAGPDLTGARDAGATADLATATDLATAADQESCVQTCADDERYWECTPSGQRVVRACPPRTYCVDGSCVTDEVAADDGGGSGGGCDCRAGSNSEALGGGLALLGLLLSITARRRH